MPTPVGDLKPSAGASQKSIAPVKPTRSTTSVRAPSRKTIEAESSTVRSGVSSALLGESPTVTDWTESGPVVLLTGSVACRSPLPSRWNSPLAKVRPRLKSARILSVPAARARTGSASPSTIRALLRARNLKVGPPIPIPMTDRQSIELQAEAFVELHDVRAGRTRWPFERQRQAGVRRSVNVDVVPVADQEVHRGGRRELDSEAPSRHRAAVRSCSSHRPRRADRDRRAHAGPRPAPRRCGRWSRRADRSCPSTDRPAVVAESRRRSRAGRST